MEKFIEVIMYLLSSYVFLFSFWRKLREDYVAKHIFTTSLLSLFGLFIFVFSLSKLNSSWWFWWSFFGSMLGLLMAIYKFNLKIYETLETFVYSSLISLIFIFVFKSVFEKGIENIFAFSYLFLMYFIYQLLDKNYKKFTWYKSGKVGFSGLVVLAFFFLVRFIVALFYPAMISFVGQGELLLSGGMFLVVMVLYLNLSKLEK